jgi:hypothetical protein
MATSVIKKSFVMCSILFASSYALSAEQTSSAGSTVYPSDRGRYDGDKIRLKVDTLGFKRIGKSGEENAPNNSRIEIDKDTGETLFLHFTSVKSCSDKITPCVESGVQYEISKSEFEKYSFSRTGVAFGGLVVPFKYYMGSGGKISASSTIAPYIGINNLIDIGWGMTITPVASAGLGLVPISNSGQTETKPALSMALGLKVTSSKNDAFSAGVIVGKDFISKTDRGNDDSVYKPWFSIYIGLAM